MPLCPNCGYEYLPEITKCPDCGAELVNKLPEQEVINDEMVLVYKTYNDSEASIIKAYLEAEGIDAIVQRDAVQDIYPSMFNELGICILVLERDKDKALEALRNHEAFGANLASEDENVRP